MRKTFLFFVVIAIPFVTVSAQTAVSGNTLFQNEYTLKWLLRTDQAFLDHNTNKAELPVFKSEAERLATSDHHEAKARLGYLYYRGLGVNESIYQSQKLLMEAEAEGNLFATFSLANLYTENKNYHSPYGLGNTKDYDKALELMRSAANAGFPPAQHFLGLFYLSGFIVEKDVNTAVSWVGKASDQGYVMAQVELGNFYVGQARQIKSNLEYAKGLPQDEAIKNKIASLERGEKENYEKAIQLYRNAADYGYWTADYKLGEMYYTGSGVEQSNETAMSWFRKAADKGFPAGHFGLYHTYMVAGGIDIDNMKRSHLYDADNENKKIALEHLKKAADGRHHTALLFMADRYSDRNQYLSSKDFSQEEWEKAKQYASLYTFEVNYERMPLENKFSIANIFNRLKDYPNAMRYFKRVVEEADNYSNSSGIKSKSIKAIGAMYLQGKGVASDVSKANHWFERFLGSETDNHKVFDIMDIQADHFAVDDPKWRYIDEDNNGNKFYYHPESIIKIGSKQDYIVLVKTVFPLTTYWKNKGLTSTPVSIRGHAYVSTKGEHSGFKTDSSWDMFQKTDSGYEFKFKEHSIKATFNLYSYPVLDQLTKKLF